MTPPGASRAGDSATAGTPPAILVRLVPLKKRRDFLRAARGRKIVKPGFILQSRSRDAGEADDHIIRVGFTCSKKVGKAVTRNRAKRRLREIARQVLPLVGREGRDYVLIGRAGATVSLPFDQMLDDISAALAEMHEPSRLATPER